jgi:DNA (cytosine-5)-methyltransferase 1
MNKSYDLIDSFCGAGGLLLGLQASGLQPIYSFDNDPLSIATQNINSKYFKHTAEVENIENLLSGKLLHKLNLKKGDLFLFAGGPPCQGFSIQRIGNDRDKRNNLVSMFVEMASELFPKYILMENVPGLQGKRGKEILAEAISKMKSIGYIISSKILDAEDYGVPQRRKRLIIVGIRKDMYWADFEFPLPTTPIGKRVTVKKIIGRLPEPPADGSDHPKISLHRRDKLSKMNLRRIRALKPGQGREFLPYDLLADCHKLSSAQIGHRNVYGRMSWDDVAPTITARFDSFTRGLFGHPEQDRSISLREGALLQTFPKDFEFVGNKVDIARQIGNAVPVSLAEVVGRQIINYHENRKIK